LESSPPAIPIPAKLRSLGPARRRSKNWQKVETTVPASENRKT
jgi:hypothetical protein